MVLSSLIPEKKSPIPGIPVIPGGTLWGGHLHLLQETNFQKALQVWAVEHADTSGRCTFYMGPTTPSLSVTHCEDVRLLLKASAHRSVFPLMETHFKQLFGTQNVGLLNGKEWKQQRSIITKALHSKGVIKHHEKAIQETTNGLVDKILELSSNDECFQCPDLVPLMKALTLDCFGKASFHVDFQTCQEQLFGAVKGNANAIGPAFDKLTQELMRRVTTNIMMPSSHLYSLPTKANRNFAHEKNKVLTFLQEIITDRQMQMTKKEAEIQSDLLSGFLEHFASTTSEHNVVNIDEKELALIIAQSSLGLLFAGYETSSITMSFTLYLLSQHPKVLKQCLEEIEQVKRDNRSDMPYLEAVIKETLRLYPPAISTTRSAEYEMELPAVAGGKINDNDKMIVPKGTYLYFAIWVIQRDPKHFDSPNDFVPERWVAYSSDRWEPRSDVNHKAWLPFSAGARACPGQRFAMQELITILSCILPKLTFETPKGYILEPSRDGFVLAPKGGIPMIIRKRKG